jgi:hypothetical protein
MTEQQPYEVVDHRSGFEVRRYPAHLVAEIEVDGTFEKAANRAFRPLASFINGSNRERRRIAMTAPVTQEVAGAQKTDMTAPVVQLEGDRPGSYLVRFVMPAGLTAQSLPAPTDTRIHTRQIPEELAAAARFSGRWTHTAFAERGEALNKAAIGAGLRPAGPIRYARFNPPWTPWFLRRNEVVLPIER